MLTIYIDSIMPTSVAGHFSKNADGDLSLCSSLGDYLFLLNYNMTHTADSVNINFNWVTPNSSPIKGTAMKNFFLYVDTCDNSCATCNGPTNVR